MSPSRVSLANSRIYMVFCLDSPSVRIFSGRIFRMASGVSGVDFRGLRQAVKDGHRSLPAKLLVDDGPHQRLEHWLHISHPVGAGFFNNGGQNRVGLLQVDNRFSHGTLFCSQTSYIVDMKSLTMLGVCSMVLLGSVTGAVVLLAQDEPIRVDVNLVSVLASVRSKNGALISNLTKDDFKIYEDGKEQQIKNFTRETDLPLTIGLLVDTSASQERLIDTEQRAASQFFSKVLRPERPGVPDSVRRRSRAAAGPDQFGAIFARRAKTIAPERARGRLASRARSHHAESGRHHSL